MAAGQRDLLRLGTTLKLDAVAGEVVEALGERGVRAIILKGSTLADRLYDSGELRAHEDVDLLVRTADVEAVSAVLRGLGFAYAADEEYAEDWIRPTDGVTVDVHTTFLGVGATPDQVWETLGNEAQGTQLGGVEVEVFGDAALAFHVALHAAQHGPKGGKALEDLRRAAERFPISTWKQAVELSDRLRAIAALAAGLRLIPEGTTVAERLGLPLAQPPDVALRAASPPPTTLGLHRLLVTPGGRRRLELLRHELAPSPTFMRAVYPLARRGPAGLGLAYVWRPCWLLWHLGPAWRAWRRAQRRSRDVSAR